MRMGLSGLNAHRNKYNFIESDLCPLCGNHPENATHFLLICPSLAAPRQVMMRDICNVFTSKLTHINFYNVNAHTLREISNILLYGSETLPFADNITLFLAVTQYIDVSKRFDL